MTLFDRIASVEIGPPGAQGLRIANSRIAFQVDKSDKPPANKAKVEIYNLSQGTRDRIRKTTDVVMIRAGYREATGEELIFTGWINLVQHSFPSPDIVSRVEAGDGQKELREARSSLSFAGNVQLSQVVQKLVDDFGFDKRPNIDVPNVRWTEGYSWVGSTAEGLRQVLDRVGYSYSVQNGLVQILPKGGANGKPVLLISSDSGLLSSPEPINQVEGDLEDSSTKKKPGWAFRCLLMPQLEPGGLVQLRSKAVTGTFRINNVRHSGDTETAQDWTSQVEVSEL